MRSTSAEQACRVRPLISIVQAPQTSSRQLQSQATGAVFLPSSVSACAAIFCSTLITFRFGSYGIRCRSQRRRTGRSPARRMRMESVLFVDPLVVIAILSHAMAGAGCVLYGVLLRPRFPDFFNHFRPDQAIQPRPRRNQRRVDLFVRQHRIAVAVERGDRRLEPLAVLLLERVAPPLGLAPPLGRVVRRQSPASRTPACSARRGIRREPARP